MGPDRHEPGTGSITFARLRYLFRPAARWRREGPPLGAARRTNRPARRHPANRL